MAVYFLLFFILILASFYVVLKKQETYYLDEMQNIIEKIRDREPFNDIRDELKDEYDFTLKSIKMQDDELKRSMDELKSYKTELDIMYNSLLAKSTQLEYSNSVLEKRVANLSNLNAISKTVLSVIDLDKIISIILDAYFVLTGAKKISLCLWESGVLVNKRTKGFINFEENIALSHKEIESFKREDYRKIYDRLGNSIKQDGERVVISELNVKGKELGVIYIVEDERADFSNDEETISALGIQVAIAINNAKMYSELLIKERLDKEVSIAADIQKNLLPKSIDSIFGLEIANYFEPAKEIGGDYYDYGKIDEDKFFVTIGDVSGKGVPAAFLMALIKAVLKTLSYKDTIPSQVLTDLNDILYPDINNEMFVTLFYSHYNHSTRELYYSNAGHNPLLVYRASEDKVVEESVKGVAVGFLDSYKYKLGKLKMEKGDILFYYTDGISEAEDIQKNRFGVDRIKELMLENKEKGVEEIKGEVLKRVNEFMNGNEQVDDITFVVIKSCE